MRTAVPQQATTDKERNELNEAHTCTCTLTAKTCNILDVDFNYFVTFDVDSTVLLLTNCRYSAKYIDSYVEAIMTTVHRGLGPS
jgi:hypothetical protein